MRQWRVVTHGGKMTYITAYTESDARQQAEDFAEGDLLSFDEV